MGATVVQNGKVQSEPIKKDGTVGVFRWQKWADGDGKLWIVALTFRFDARGIYGANVELLDVDKEKTIEVPRAEFDEWVRTGALKRIDTPILL